MGLGMATGPGSGLVALIPTPSCLLKTIPILVPFKKNKQGGVGMGNSHTHLV